LVSRDLPTAYVEGLFAAPNVTSADYPALYVATSILRDRLFEEIRIKRNLSYAPSSWIFRRSANLGAVYVTTPNPTAALQVMSTEIRRMQTSLVPEAELRDAINAARTDILQNLQASADIADWLGSYEVEGAGWQTAMAALTRFNSVTPEDVRTVM